MNLNYSKVDIEILMVAILLVEEGKLSSLAYDFIVNLIKERNSVLDIIKLKEAEANQINIKINQYLETAKNKEDEKS